MDYRAWSRNFNMHFWLLSLGHQRVAAAWDPHLAGTTSLEHALDGLVAAWPAS